MTSSRPPLPLYNNPGNQPPTPPSEAKDSEPDISLLISPTKARLAATTSVSWSYVDTRLSQLFHPSPTPRIERNAATLAALLDLLAANAGADQERKLLHEAEVEALRRDALPGGNEGVEDPRLRLRVRQRTKRAEFLTSLSASLPAGGKGTLDDLAASCVLLSCARAGGEGDVMAEMETRVVETTREVFDAEGEVLRLRRVLGRFEREGRGSAKTVTGAAEEGDGDDNAEGSRSNAEEMQAATAAMNRETKVLGMKLQEYRERVAALRGYDVGRVSVEDIVAMEERVRERQEQIEGLEERLVAMHGLPPDLDVSRREVERARNELEGWKRRRDRAFEGLLE